MRHYVNEALERNPGVHEAFGRYRAALERVPQADTLPDLVFSFTQSLRSVETRVGPVHNSFNLLKPFLGSGCST